MIFRTTIPTARKLYFPTVPHDAKTLEKLESAFFGSIRQRNGTYKLTYANRLNDLNDIVANLLPTDRPLRFMDVAVSSGVTTLDWANALDRLGIAYTMTAGDIGIRAYLLELGWNLSVLVDQNGYPLQYEIFGHAVPNPPARRMLPVYLPWIMYLKATVRRHFVRARAVRPADGVARFGQSLWCRALTLVSPRLLVNNQIELIEDDILANRTIHDCFHVIRAANILNRSYFDEPTIIDISTNLGQRLVEGGLLVVCRTSDDRDEKEPVTTLNNGSIFRRGGNKGFSVVSRIGRGSEVEDLVRAVRPLSQSFSPQGVVHQFEDCDCRARGRRL
jgi:hypothetical protein